MNIEEVAHENPDAIITEPVDIIKGSFELDFIYTLTFKFSRFPQG